MRININGTWKTISRGVFNINGVWKSISRGVININGVWKNFWASGGPSQVTKPTLSGTGAARSNVTRTSGTYSNELSVTTKILKTTFAIPDDGLKTAPDGILTTSNPYFVTQYDAAVIAYTLYAVDIVTGQDGEDYYYYSLPKETYIPSFSDSFNRGNSGSLGTMSSGFVYDSDGNWGISSSQAYNAGSGNYNRAIVSVGATDTSLSVAIPDGKGGVGLTFWGTSGGSYWAAFPSYSYEEILDYPIWACLPPGVSTEDCPVIATGGNGPLGYYLESQLGKRCSACIPTTVSTYRCPDTYNATNTAAQGCPESDGSPTLAEGRICPGGCFTNYYYPCTGDRVIADEDCTLRSGDNEYAGDKCNCSSPYTVNKPSCTQLSYSYNSACPDVGPNTGDRCGACDKYCNVGVSNSSSCPGSGTDPEQRCTDCIPSTSIEAQCSNTQYCYTQNCCANITRSGSTPDRCSDCTDLTTTETVYDYSRRSTTPTTTYPCNVPVSGASSCPTYRADPTGAGQRCSSTCTPSTTTTYGSCKTPGANDPSGCVRAPAGYTACAVGLVRCPSSTTTYSYTASGSSSTYLCDDFVSGAASCPGTTGTGAGQRCSTCTTRTVTNYAYLFIRNQNVTVTKYSYTKNSPWYFNVRNTTPTTVYDHNTKVQAVLSYDYKMSILDTTSTTNVYNVVTASSTTAYSHKTRLRIANSGSVVSESSLSGAPDYLSSSYNDALYNKVYGLSASTSGNQISVVAYADSTLSTSIGGTTYTSSGTKGTYIGIIKGPTSDLIGDNLDNLSYTRVTSV